MAVLIEAISVVVLKSAVERSFLGGMDGFEKVVPTAAFCFDEDLARVGFMDTTDADAYVGELAANGLRFDREGSTPDGVIVIQRSGPLVDVEWLTFANVEIDQMKLSICWRTGTEPRQIAMPGHWTYEGSLSDRGPGFMHASMVGDRLKFLRREGNVEVYLDLQTNKELYAARPKISGETPGALHTQIMAIIHEVMAIEEKGPIPQPRFWQRADPRYTRLHKDLLPELQRICNGPGRDLPSAHFGLAVAFRVLNRPVDVERCLRRAHQLNPESSGILKDLVRCLGEQNRPHEALPFAREAVRLEPTDEGILGNLAATLMHCGELEESLRVISDALELNPDDKINIYIRDALHKRLGRKA